MQDKPQPCKIETVTWTIAGGCAGSASVEDTEADKRQRQRERQLELERLLSTWIGRPASKISCRSETNEEATLQAQEQRAGLVATKAKRRRTTRRILAVPIRHRS